MCTSCRASKKLSNAYFLAKFRFDTAENEPAKNLENFAKFANFADPNPLTLAALRDLPAAVRRVEVLADGVTSAVRASGESAGLLISGT